MAEKFHVRVEHSTVTVYEVEADDLAEAATLMSRALKSLAPMPNWVRKPERQSIVLGVERKNERNHP